MNMACGNGKRILIVAGALGLVSCLALVSVGVINLWTASVTGTSPQTVVFEEDGRFWAGYTKAPREDAKEIEEWKFRRLRQADRIQRVLIAIGGPMGMVSLVLFIIRGVKVQNRLWRQHIGGP
jgi:hypothetical protein